MRSLLAFLIVIVYITTEAKSGVYISGTWKPGTCKGRIILESQNGPKDRHNFIVKPSSSNHVRKEIMVNKNKSRIRTNNMYVDGDCHWKLVHRNRNGTEECTFLKHRTYLNANVYILKIRSIDPWSIDPWMETDCPHLNLFL